MTRRTMRLRVSGLVQGVGFRAWTADRAQALGLDGWVRNEDDGTVAALVSGDAAAVEEMIAALRRGPPGARVDGIDAAEAGPQPGLSGFDIRR